jgi:hypothetical protein
MLQLWDVSQRTRRQRSGYGIAFGANKYAVAKGVIIKNNIPKKMAKDL